MYLMNLAAEKARRDITNGQIGEEIGKSKNTVAKKMSGEIEWKRSEMIKVRNKFFPDCTLDYLYAIENETT